MVGLHARGDEVYFRGPKEIGARRGAGSGGKGGKVLKINARGNKKHRKTLSSESEGKKSRSLGQRGGIIHEDRPIEVQGIGGERGKLL